MKEYVAINKPNDADVNAIQKSINYIEALIPWVYTHAQYVQNNDKECLNNKML